MQLDDVPQLGAYWQKSIHGSTVEQIPILSNNLSPKGRCSRDGLAELNDRIKRQRVGEKPHQKKPHHVPPKTL